MGDFLPSINSLRELRQRIRAEKGVGTPQSEQVRLLYSHLPAAILISAVLASIFAGVQASVIDPDRVLMWLAALAAVLLGRAGLFVAWRGSARVAGESETDRWLRWFRIGVFATGLVWGVGGVLLAPSGDLVHKIYASFVLAGLSAGAATTLAVDRISAFGFFLLVMVPHIVFLTTEGDTVSLGMSATYVLFLVFLLSSARLTGLRLEENFRLRHRASENELQFRLMLESSPIATRIADAATNRVVFANSSYISLIGSTPQKVMDVIPSDYYALPEVYADVVKQLRTGGYVTNKLVELSPPGEQTWSKWVLASYFPVEYEDKPAILGWFYDITDRKIIEDRVEHMAYHDPLTGLPNRSLFLDRLEQALAGAGREQTGLGLMFIDLDKFKPVNDCYGHHIGDLLLKAVAERVLACLRTTDSAARLGGDEFVVLLPSVGSERNAVRIAEKIRAALNEPFEIEGLTFNISSSTGVAIYPDHADGEQQLLKRADLAMYHAKSRGRDCVEVYRPELSKESA